jgi:hypothetical protein
MEYLVEAKKFIERAHNAVHPEVIKTELEVAEWFLSQAINERGEKPDRSHEVTTAQPRQ